MSILHGEITKIGALPVDLYFFCVIEQEPSIFQLDIIKITGHFFPILDVSYASVIYANLLKSCFRAKVFS